MKLGIRTKLVGSFAMVLVLMFALGAVSYQALRKTNGAADRQADTSDKVAQIGELALALRSLQDDPTDYMATGNTADRSNFQTHEQTAKRLLADRIRQASETTKPVYNDMDAKLNVLLQVGSAVLAVDNPIGDQQVIGMMDAIDEAAATMNQDVEKLTAIADKDSEAARREADALESKTNKVLLGMVILDLLLGFGLAAFMSQSISRAVMEVAGAAKRLADGDLGIEELKIHAKDETGEMAAAFNRMVRNLRQLVQQVTNSAQTVAGSSEELTATSQQVAQAAQGVAQTVTQVAQGASGQSKSVQETTETMEQLRTAIAQIAAGAQEQAGTAQQTSHIVAQMAQSIADVGQKAADVSSSSQRATQTARAGTQVVEKTIDGMGRIRKTVLNSAEKVAELGRLSEKVGQITSVITDIADQTNLLALNAAIEAARAGEHGKGFAVVADEVRKLAERAGSSAKEISDLVHAIQGGTEQAVKAMELGTTEVEEGSRLSVDAGKALGEILAVVEQTTRDAEAIRTASQQVATATQELVRSVEAMAAVTEENTAATEEMAAGSDQVTRSIQNVAALSEENAASAEEVSASVEEVNASTEEIAASAQELAQIAQQMLTQVSHFKL
ncbi:MAG: methyl-accepting chemotaxis protein [Symbiobacteriia bacterium]